MFSTYGQLKHIRVKQLTTSYRPTFFQLSFLGLTLSFKNYVFFFLICQYNLKFYSLLNLFFVVFVLEFTVNKKMWLS